MKINLLKNGTKRFTFDIIKINGKTIKANCAFYIPQGYDKLVRGNEEEIFLTCLKMYNMRYTGVSMKKTMQRRK